MAVIKARNVEFEVIRQDVEGAAAKYLIKLSFEPMQFQSKEIVSLILCDRTPYITLANEDGSVFNILQKTGPEGHTTRPYRPPEEVFPKKPTREQYLQDYIQDEDMEYAKGKLTQEDLAWRTKK